MYLVSQLSFRCKSTTTTIILDTCTICNLSLKPLDKGSIRSSCLANVANQHITFTYTQLLFTKHACGCFESLYCFCFKLGTCQFRYPSDGQLHFMHNQCSQSGCHSGVSQTELPDCTLRINFSGESIPQTGGLYFHMWLYRRRKCRILNMDRYIQRSEFTTCTTTDTSLSVTTLTLSQFKS